MATKNARDFGATGDGATDDRAAIESAQASASPGDTLYFPAGTYVIGGASLLFRKSRITWAGEARNGRPAATLKRAAGATTATLAGSISFPDLRTLIVRDLRFEWPNGETSGTAHGINLPGSARVKDVLIQRCEFYNCPAYCITMGGTEDVVIADCHMSRPGDAISHAIQAGQGSRRIAVRGGSVRWCDDGFLTDGTPCERITIDGWEVDLGWWLIKAMAGSVAQAEGAGISYTANTLVNSGVDFTSLALDHADVDHTIRVMPVKATGGAGARYYGTTRRVGGPKMLTDPAADFSGASRGDILRVGSTWGVVVQGFPRKVIVEDWLDADTYAPVAPPARDAAYVLYGVILGHIGTADPTDTTITLHGSYGGGGWFDLDGNRVVPPAGTRYEILVTRPNYPVNFGAATTDVEVTRSTFRRGFSDQLSTFGDRAVFTSNVIEDGQDMGMTVHGYNNVVSRNIVRRSGAAGIFTDAVDSVFESNRITDSLRIHVQDNDLGNISLRSGSVAPGSSGCVFRKNILESRARRDSTGTVIGLSIAARTNGVGVDDVVLDGNETRFNRDAGIGLRELNGGTIGAVVFRKNKGAVVDFNA